MNRDNIIYKTIRIILTGFTLATVLAVSLGSVDIFTAGLLNYAVFLEYLYGIVITVGIVVVLVKLWMFPNIKDGITLKEARTCRLIANIFLIEFLCELIHGALSNKGDRLFEVFNVRVSVLMIVFLLCAFAFMSVGKLLVNYIELQEDNKLTV
ncbi:MULTISPECIES: hypothetical protein [Mogibacterium]|jgi:hypothetical protein|uniref:DUF2975 domain-containing protein n=1 Tax=Mogibacterium timidum ATCC 33093 TaxID=1401079 RepID=X8IU53_9FIRM|nr:MULTISPECIES: hypothetical protein [Mogibacterium]EJU23118.1 hypothetical protein HMPREF1152_1799 [Mogibacterium sp. CM50]EUC52729.1 hypothetical protein HMPREF0581_1450 [Mogibacterium timidum ATCC 33093]